jgi:nitroreductase
VWEQVASASCTGYAVVLAATGLGYGAVWKSAAVLDAAPVRELFGLATHEHLLGWVNLGTPAPLGRAKADRPADAAVRALEGRVARITG